MRTVRQLLLVPYAFCHVGLHTHIVSDITGTVAQRRHAQMVPKHRSIAPHISQGRLADSVLTQSRSDFIQPRLFGVPILQKAAIFTQDFVGGVAGHSLERRVYRHQLHIARPCVTKHDTVTRRMHGSLCKPQRLRGHFAPAIVVTRSRVVFSITILCLAPTRR